MKIDRDAKDILKDFSTIANEINKLDKIKELMGRQGWYSYDEFIDELQDILGIEEDSY